MYFGNHLLKIQIWYVVIQHTFFEKSWWNFVTRQITSKSSTDKCNLHSSRFPSQRGWSGYIMIASPIRVTRVWRWNCQVNYGPSICYWSSQETHFVLFSFPVPSSLSLWLNGLPTLSWFILGITRLSLMRGLFGFHVAPLHRVSNSLGTS